MAKLGPRSIAQQLDSWGFNVLPTPHQQKSPRVPWKQWVNERATHLLPSWFSTAGTSNYWIATGGISNCYVLDVDTAKADEWWRTAVNFAESMDSTVRARSAKGTHYFFFVPSEDRAKGWSYHDDGIDFDVRGTGGGVVVPPSIHESGAVYEWIQAPDPELPMMGMQPAPDWLKSREGVRKQLESLGSSDTATLSKPVEPLSNTASMLSTLLSRPPAEGGRNDWLARVAGHYAKTYRQQQDLYFVHVKQAAALLRPPLPDAEIRKLVNSIWSKEVLDHPERDMESAGWLVGGGDRLLTQVRYGKGEDAEYKLVEWADFDMRVQGVLAREGSESDLVYDVLVTHKRDGRKQQVLVDGATLGNGSKLMVWLAGMGLSISRPENTYPTNPLDNLRLLRYLDSQSAPRARMAQALGWDEESKTFLTFDGIIRADGLHPFETVRPNPELLSNGTLRYEYGFEGNLAEAREALAEILTYHDETTAAVFGAWWAACLLKPQLAKAVALFPIMAIEAASGAGKTNGMFKLMIQLAGSIDGPGTMTYAVARNRLASHQSGIAWLDDLESVDGKLLELMRVLTSGEDAAKMAPDNSAIKAYTLRAPLVVSGEYLGFGSQKALLDRVVMLNPPKPDTRRSLKPGREHLPQWDDIVDFNERYPQGPWTIAGHLVAHALTLETRALAYLRQNLREIKETLTGRPADRLAVLLAGAWVLDRLLEDLEDDAIGPWETKLRAWSDTGASVLTAGEWDNRLTLEVLPWALRERQWPASPKGAPPVWVAESTDMFGPTVWVNVAQLAGAWRDNLRGRVVDRTDTSKALLDQVRRCQTAPHSRRFDVYQGNRRQLLYWGLTGDVAETVLERSQS